MRQAQRDIVAMRRGFPRCAGLMNVHLEQLERNGIIGDMMKNECWTWVTLLGHGESVPGQLSRVSCRCG